MVTRTMNITVVEAMIVETTTAEVRTLRLTIVGEFDADSALKKAKAQYETDTLKVVTATIVDEYTQLMGVTEQMFYDMAEVLPDR